MSGVQPIKNASLMAQAFESLRDAIFAGRLLPGDPLRELHLARDLRVSQVVVREALVKLEHMGLVVRAPNRGTMVTKLSSREVRERLAIRVALEEIAFAEAAPHVTPQDARELRRLGDEISRGLKAKNFFEAAQADLGFHRYVWEKSGNETLSNMLTQVTVPLFAFVSILRRSGFEGLKDAQKSHEELVEALEGGSVRIVKRAIRQHIESSYETFLESGVEDFQILARKLA